VDGSPLENSAPADAALISNSAHFLIGAVTLGAPEGRFTGLIDEVQVYTQVLTANEVDFLYHNPALVVPEPGVFALLAIGGLSLAWRRKNS